MQQPPAGCPLADGVLYQVEIQDEGIGDLDQSAGAPALAEADHSRSRRPRAIDDAVALAFQPGAISLAGIRIGFHEQD